jgi:alpha-L-fucosidase
LQPPVALSANVAFKQLGESLLCLRRLNGQNFSAMKNFGRNESCPCWSHRQIWKRYLPLAALLVAPPITLAAEMQKAGAPAIDGPFKPEWQSLKAHKAPEWFRDAKFGIYTHWGPVTVGCEDAPRGGEWYGREMYLTNNPIFAWHKQKFGDQRTFGYKDVIPLFTAPKFDPEKWAELFARAGAKFAGPVAVHHDNFALWDCAVTPWNSMRMGPKRDITGELAKAYRARGLKFLPTFHHGFAWRYFEPAFNFDAADGKNFLLYSEPHGPKDPPSQRFQEQWLAMVMEVVRKYEPDMIWFDFELKQVITPEYQQRMFAEYYNWAAARGKESAVAHKFRELHAYTGILDFERGREDRLVPYPWLTDTALGPWFNRNADKYRSTENLIHVLADIVSKNGCMLLNVGPNADGSIPERAEKMLNEIGDWLKVNGEAIYGTRPWLAFGEGPTRAGGGGGFSEGKDPSFTARDIRFTTKGDALYAITLGWPEREFNITAIQVDSSPAARVELLGHGVVPHRRNAEKQIVVSLPALSAAHRPCAHAFVFKLTGFKTSLHPIIRFEQPDAVRLEPEKATCEGALRLQINEGRPNIGFWDVPGDRLHWLAHVKAPGRYTLRGEFSSAYAASALKVSVAGQTKSVEVPKTDGWFKPQFVTFGEFQFDKSGVFHLVLEPSSPDRWRAVNVYQIQLAKME